jgi:polyisoprenyl-phosphate glycosyltransferase
MTQVTTIATSDHRPLVTISVPVYNEEQSIPALLARLRAVAASVESSYRFEFLFTDNASEDGSFAMLATEARKDPRIRVLRFSRNFGFQRSILTNYLNARGVVAIQLDADLQDPPELIVEFLKLWREGYKVVYGIRQKREEGAVKEASRKLFYRFLDHISDLSLPRDAGDFRLIDRVIIDHLRDVTDRNPYLRGIIASLGYPQIGVPYVREGRSAGRSKFNLQRLVKLGMDGVTSQSTRPLQYITYFGFALCGVIAVLSLVYLVQGLTMGMSPTPGFTTLVLLSLFSIGMNALFLGILGEYVARIFDNVRGHPFTIIERVIDQGTEEAHIQAPKLKADV